MKKTIIILPLIYLIVSCNSYTNRINSVDERTCQMLAKNKVKELYKYQQIFENDSLTKNRFLELVSVLNTDGKPTKITYFNSDSTVKSYKIFKYNKDYTSTEIYEGKDTDRLTLTFDWKIDIDNKIETLVYYDLDGELKEYYIYKDNDYWEPISAKVYNKDSVLTETLEFEYKNTNNIKSIQKDNKGNIIYEAYKTYKDSYLIKEERFYEKKSIYLSETVYNDNKLPIKEIIKDNDLGMNTNIEYSYNQKGLENKYVLISNYKENNLTLKIIDETYYKY